MSTETSKLRYDVGNASSVAIKVVQRLRALAKELHLEDYIDSDDFEKKVKPKVPDSGAIEVTRRYEMHLAEYKAEIKALKELREAGENSISTSAMEHLCAMMGRSTSDMLEAKEIVDGIKQHFATLTSAEEDKLMNELQEAWAEGSSLTKHVISQAAKVADLKAGGKDMTDKVSKDTLWRSMAKVKRNPIYSGLTDAMTVQLEREEVTYQAFVAKLLTELKKEQYSELNVDAKVDAGESVFAVKDKKSREEKLKEKMKANRLKYSEHPLDEQCPVHPKNEHTWGSCSHYKGKKYVADK